MITRAERMQLTTQQAYILTVRACLTRARQRLLTVSSLSKDGWESGWTSSPTSSSWSVGFETCHILLTGQLIAIFGSLFRNTVDPAKFGVVLTYTMAAATLFANLVSLYAQVEQEMVSPYSGSSAV